jgi:hypothetical protein
LYRAQLATAFASLGIIPRAPDLTVIHGARIYVLDLKDDTGWVSEEQVVCHTPLGERGRDTALQWPEGRL